MVPQQHSLAAGLQAAACSILSSCISSLFRCLQAAALLNDIDFFSLPQSLVDAAQAEAVVQIMLRFLDAAAALGDGFLRCLVAIMILLRQHTGCHC